MPSREKVVELALRGIRPKAIAEQLGCEPTTVHALISAARRKGVVIPHFGKGVEPAITPPEAPVARNLVIPIRLFSLLQKRSEERSMTVQEYAQTLLERALLGTIALNDENPERRHS